MQNTQKKSSFPIIIVGVVILILGAGGFLFLSKKITKQPTLLPSPNLLDNDEDVFPTVDPSVKVLLTTSAGNKEAVLNLSSIPKGTETIDYELSYQEKQKGLQGVIGTISVTDKDDYEKKVTLGTCSSGRCVYHDIVGKIKLTVKFSGSFGNKIFEKEYDI